MVACGSATSCMAVGSTSFCSDDGCTTAAQALRWDGSRWSEAGTVSRRSWYENGLSGVSCTSSDACTAVGYSDIGSAGGFGGEPGCTVYPLVEQLERQSLINRNHQARRGPTVGLHSVLCTSSTACIAVGSFGRRISAERRNGSRCSIQRVAKALGVSAISLTGISCISNKNCTAVGSFTDSTNHQVPLVERWTPSRWSIERTPRPTGAAT